MRDIAERTALPQPYLEQILLALKGAGLVRSKRGVGGGYQLNRPANQITVGDVLRLIDGEFIPIDRVTSGATDCSLTQFFCKLQELVNQHLNEHTIEDLFAMERPKDILAFEI